jgi:ABC-type multidrug transport system fused ATPase/permease subunit
MRQLPYADPGDPDTRTPGRLLWWLARGQWVTLLGAAFFGTVWTLAQAVTPALIGRAVDEGVAAQDTTALLGWALALFGVGVVQAASGIARHRFAVTNWLIAAYRIVQLVTRRSVSIGAALPDAIPAGEVASIGATDLGHFGNLMDVIGRLVGSVVAFVAITVVLLRTSTSLGLVVAIGVPVLLVALGPILRPLQTRTLAQREMTGRLNSLANDIVGGLRVLRGIGGEETFHARYARQSQRVRDSGVRVGRLQSVLDALQVLLPGLFVVVVVWLGARLAVRGDISAGQLVALYGYAAFLLVPLRTATEAANKAIRAHVAAVRVCRLWAVRPAMQDPESPVPLPATGDLVDGESGLVVRQGLLSAVVSDDPTTAAVVADRLGRYREGRVTFGGVDLAAAALADVRATVLVSDAGASLFSGRLRDVVSAHPGASDTTVQAAMATASAADVLEASPDGYDTGIEERGRSLSGGQRQRLVLARALVADPAVLVLVEPTSAVDAHTEARVADRLAQHRRGRTTLVTTSSPLLLDRVDEVVFLRGGRVAATGTHRELLDGDPVYRDLVTRGEDE